MAFTSDFDIFYLLKQLYKIELFTIAQFEGSQLMMYAWHLNGFIESIILH